MKLLSGAYLHNLARYCLETAQIENNEKKCRAQGSKPFLVFLQSYCPLKTEYNKFCPGYNSRTVQGIDLKLHRKIDDNGEK